MIKNIDRVHTTELGLKRINKNLGFIDIDVVEWCKEKILDIKSIIIRKCKNWYVYTDEYKITVNASSYTIITYHMRKDKNIF